MFRSAVFSPDGTRVVTASEDRIARVWNAATGEPLGEPMEHDGHIVSAVFSSPDGRLCGHGERRTTRRAVWDRRGRAGP